MAEEEPGNSTQPGDDAAAMAEEEPGNSVQPSRYLVSVNCPTSVIPLRKKSAQPRRYFM
jgi:hypothetical protein